MASHAGTLRGAATFLGCFAVLYGVLELFDRTIRVIYTPDGFIAVGCFLASTSPAVIDAATPHTRVGYVAIRVVSRKGTRVIWVDEQEHRRLSLPQQT